jgi:hypothetical protein
MHKRKLTRIEKTLLSKLGYNPKMFLRVDKTCTNLKFVHRDTNKILDIKY